MSFHTFFIFTTLTLFFTTSSTTNVALNDDVLGLTVFKSDIKQDPFSKLTSWKEEDDTPCNWVGVTCDPYSNRVTELNLNGFSLSGHISKGLLRLQFLQKLSINRNNFTGVISNPVVTQLIKSLQFADFGYNNFHGSLTDDMFMQCGSVGHLNIVTPHTYTHLTNKLRINRDELIS